jgi:tetratricopeptide (TPR) repeat protein
VQPAEDLGGIWLGTVIPESDPEIQEWQQAWRHGLASLNQQRNPLRERFACPLVLVGAPWLHTLLREAAPDLWSVRTGVVAVAPSLEPASTATREPGLIETSPGRLLTGEAASDPDYALEQAERLQGKPALEPVRAQLLLRAGNGFYMHARLDSAERCFRTAADLFAASAVDNPDLQADLAGTLNNLANSLGALGRREEALAKAQEAVRIFERLAKARPDAFLPGLAGSLNNLSNSLGALGRREEALAKAQEAARIYEQLAQTRPDAFLPDLAGALNNLALRLADLGRREEALAKAQEAVRIFEQLAKARPDAFLPDLAMSLNNLATRLGELGRREEALAKAQEAARIHEQLALATPAAFGPELARSTSLIRDCLRAVGKHKPAAEAAREALAQLKPHFLAVPQAHAGLIQILVNDYMESVERVHSRPDEALLAPVLEILQQPKQNPKKE